MNDLIFDLISGLGIGALYAMLAAGLVVSYKGSGVINFAHGAIAMYGVVTFDAAWNRGELFLPWVDFLPTHTVNLPVRITLSETGRPVITDLMNNTTMELREVAKVGRRQDGANAEAA